MKTRARAERQVPLATTAPNGPSGKNPETRRRLPAAKRLWWKARMWVRSNPVLRWFLVSFLTLTVRVINLTNPWLAGSREQIDRHRPAIPVIVALWHGQHIMAPFIKPGDVDMVALFSRSADAELNAQVARRFGIDVVRGSGGRKNTNVAEKGGASALIALKRALDAGRNVCMIADIPHGTPREAGLGIVTLARLSGRPVIPVAYASSRRKVLEKTWDKTTINLPFGRAAVVSGDPIFVPADTDEAAMETYRRQVTDALNAVTAKAYARVDGQA